MRCPGLLCLLLAVLGACSSPEPNEDEGSGGGGSQGPVSVMLGTPGGDSGLDFVPLTEGQELRLQTFGQGGTHLLIGVRCTGFGRRAFVSGSLRNLQTGVEVLEPAPARPQLLYCGDDVEGACELVPFLVHASGLTDDAADRDGLRVSLAVQVRNEAGAASEASREIVLSTVDL